MAAQPNEVEEKDANPLDSLPLGSQAAADYAATHYGVVKTGQVVKHEDDGDAVYSTGDVYQDKDHDGVDDDDEAHKDDQDDADWFPDFDNDASGLYSGDNDYCRMDRYGSRFNQYYNNAAPADQAAFDAAKQAQLTAAQAPLTADNFLALKRADTKLNIAGSTIVANAGGPEAPAAAARIQGLKGADIRLQNIETSLQGKTIAEKEAILKKDFPRQWERYEEGKPAQTGPRNGASYSSAQNDLPGGATEQPFSQRLYQLFASAVTPSTTVTPAPALTVASNAPVSNTSYNNSLG